MTLPVTRSSVGFLTILFLVVLVVLVVLPRGLAAASEAATLTGRVLDPDARAVVGARVVIAGPLGVVASTVTDEAGGFAVKSLPAGRFEVLVEASGFRADPQTVMLAAGDDTKIELKLSISAIAESVVVSASTTEVARSRAPASITVLTRENLAVRQIESVADAVRLAPGMVVNRSGGRGALTSVFPRGGDSNFTMVLVDGVRLNAMGGDYDFGHLPTADIERVEIVRGPQSALFGSDAIGGVVSVITRQGGRTRGEVTVEGGSLGTVQAAAGVAGTVDAFDVITWGATIERAQSDGFRGRSSGGEAVSNDDYRRHTFSASAGWQLRPGREIRGTARVASQERGFPGPFGSDPGHTYSGVDRVSRGATDTRALSLSTTQAFGARTRLRGQLTRTDIDGSFVSSFGPSESSTDRTTLRAQADSSLTDRLGVSAGFEWLDERAGSSYITDSNDAEIPITRDNLGLFAEARYEPSRRLLIATGVRIERIHRDELAADVFSGRPLFGADTRTSVNPKLAISTWLVPATATSATWTRLHGNAGTGIRAPDAFEIAFTNNPSLAPERSRSVDIGVEQAFLAGRLIADVTAFSNRYDDLIVAVGRSQQDASRYLTDNIANARSRGLELSLAGHSRGIDARVAYTWLDTEILAVDGQSGEAPVPFSPGDALFRRPRHQVTFDVTVARPRWSAFATVRARGGTLDIDPSFGTFGGLYRAPGYGVVNGGGRVRLVQGVHLFARVENLFDWQYEEALGFRALGRTAMVGVTLAASR